MQKQTVPPGMQVVLYKDRDQYPGEALKAHRRIIAGRDTWLDPRILGWLVPKAELNP